MHPQLQDSKTLRLESMQFSCARSAPDWRTIRAGPSNELVDQVFEVLLPAARVRGDVAVFEHGGFEFPEPRLPLLDLGPDAAVPRCVALFSERVEPPVLADG